MKSVIVCLLLTPLVLTLHISYTTLRAYPCQVYPPGRAWAALPTLVSLRPTTTIWSTQIHILDLETRLLACILLMPRKGKLDVFMSTGDCGSTVVNKSIWDIKDFGQDSWTNVEVSVKDSKLKLNVRGTRQSMMTPIPDLPYNLVVMVDNTHTVSVSFGCPRGCYIISELPKSSLKLGRETTFFVLPFRKLKKLKFRVHLKSCFRNEDVGKKDLGLPPLREDQWNVVNFKVEDDKYTVEVNGQQELLVTFATTYCHRSSDFYLSVEGEALWSFNCKPESEMSPVTTTTTTTVTVTPPYTSSPPDLLCESPTTPACDASPPPSSPISIVLLSLHASLLGVCVIVGSYTLYLAWTFSRPHPMTPTTEDLENSDDSSQQMDFSSPVSAESRRSTEGRQRPFSDTSTT
ncbi:hypothetical protein Hamer_G011414 [Homarus americanus]|uniref:Uncharacterized protein n=1 Tax=Homarus americanus TaxID=6706 RepID=A0A8J5JIN9_HOMAM|nr:hypothetical protein Hamer_G011414 [Homarus americanus]